ncbi:hypothetical protein [Micromonospora sp. CPCC 206061]|uniref:hypothetical protein n=1 Tax=Micromonospora sp. CPCC 206061 TaxID=3122410 RepID=UPI002FF1A6A5
MGDDLTEAVTVALEAAAISWAALLGTDMTAVLGERIAASAPRIAAQLHTPGEQQGTAADLLDVIGHPGDDDPTWWTTELGRAIAHALDDQGVSQTEAALLLGVTKGTISQLVARGTLARVAGGQVSLTSVLDRLASRPVN